MDGLLENLDQHLLRFGLTSFRPGQREVISALLERKDCLCIMPTGGGKSLSYQLPAIAREGLTLVVSPLIALMKDQVDALQAIGIAATFINSSLSPAEQRARMDEMAEGRYDLVYIAPERLRSSMFLEKLRQTTLQLLAVDEAHCISEWGHDFRPDYARLGILRQRLGFPQTIALTATATPEVRDDVARQLQLREPQVFITGFARTNLRFEVRHALSGLDKDETLFQFLEETPGAGIIYAATRKQCEELVETLHQRLPKRRSAVYHAGLEPDVRRRVQEDFMQGRTPIIVATNAFGMGIDKSDLRFVVHYNIPGSLEAYYQEAGRAGRDGKPSRCLLLYMPKDRRTQEFFIDSAYPEPDIVKTVYDYLRGIPDDPIEITLEEIRERLNLPIRSDGVSACEKLLEGCRALERLDSRQNMAGVKIDSELPTLVDLLPREAKVQRRVLRTIENLVGELRGERVFLNPRQIAEEAEIDLGAANRALRELSKLAAFDYVPPFRGRAVHMLERKKPFDQLGIDFAEQERRREAEYVKLDRMIAYATTSGCRQLAILDYFGDPSKKKCGLCDNCDGASGGLAAVTSAADQSPSTPAVLEAVRMVLSGAARMQGRFGKIMLAKMLVGSASAKITKAGLDRLSTYGVMKHLAEDEVIGLVDGLLRLRLLQQVEKNPHRPLVELTPRGLEVMRGQAELNGELVLDPALRAKLARLQPNKMAEPKSRPATEPVAALPPSDVAAAATFHETDFDPFDEANADQDEPILHETTQHVAHSAHDSSIVRRPPHYWTWRLLSAGFALDECRYIRGLAREAIYDHVLRAAREGQPIDAAWLLTADQLSALEKLIGHRSPEQIRPLLANLPNGIQYRDVQLYLLARGTGEE